MEKITIDSLGGVLHFPHASLSQCKKLSTKCHLPKAEGKGGKASFLGGKASFLGGFFFF